MSHPASFLDTLLLVAAFDRPIRCLVERSAVRGLARSLFVWGLDMIPLEAGENEARQAIDEALNTLEQEGSVAVLAGQESAGKGEPSQVFLIVASLALEAESRLANLAGLKIFPVHLFLPIGQLHANEMLVHIDAPTLPSELLPLSEGSRPARVAALAQVVEDACRQNTFSLRPEDVEYFLADTEEVLRAGVAGDWASRHNWKQTLEGFELSGFFVEWVNEMNNTNPGRLASLRGMLDDYREASRRWSLAQFEIELAGEWIESAWSRNWGWIESAFGLPVAVFGLLNHFLILLVLSILGLLNKDPQKKETTVWMARAGVVLAFYTAQILMCDSWLGRSAAGYYALTLPASGAILWRYYWLLPHRTRLLYLRLRSAQKAAALKRLRTEFLGEVEKARDVYVEALGLPI